MPITMRAQKFNPDGTAHPPGSWFAIADSKSRGARATKNTGGSWSNVAHNTGSGCGNNPDGRKASGGSWFHDATPGPIRSANSKSLARKAASARIAKIPVALAQHIAHVYRPERRAEVA